MSMEKHKHEYIAWMSKKHKGKVFYGCLDPTCKLGIWI
jgi:hypothetical protein